MAIRAAVEITRLNSLIGELNAQPSLENGVAVSLAVLALLGENIDSSPSDVVDSGLIKLPNSERQDSWFHQHPWMRGERSAFEILDSSTMPLQAKFYWLQKKGNTFVAGGVHFTTNWEDHEYTRTEDFKVGIDFFLSPDAASLLVVLSNMGKLRVLELSKKLTNTQIEIFQKWMGLEQIQNRHTLHNLLWESFRIQSVNTRFYAGVSDSYNELVTHLKNSGREVEPSKLFASRLLGRLIFLWFLKKMGLISSAMSYFDASLENQGEYYRQKLEQLFFMTLNKPIDQRIKSVDGILDLETPYLNGGLFSPRVDDWCGQAELTFPPSFFQRVFEHFENFNFTTDESTPDYEQVAIDPEMLGRVFESLLASQVEATGELARKSKGAFYTPREIVAFMCKEAIRAYLLKISPDETLKLAVSKLLDTTDQDWAIAGSNSLRDIPTELRGVIADSLNRLKSLDPACGSGAFPLGLLQVLSRIHLRLDPRLDQYKLKLSILKNNIFGVDIEPMAVEISRLRSWLSLIVEEADRKNVEPLPNLDFNFICANSLVPLVAEDLLSDPTLQERLNALRADYFSATLPEQKSSIQQKYDSLISPNLFDDFDLRSKYLKTFNPFESNQVASFFDAGHMFGCDSFDVIIGNPPYEVLEGTHWKSFTELVRSIPSYKFSLGGRLNLFRLFIERSWHLLGQGAVLSFIVPSTLISDKNTSGIRKLFMSQGTLDFLIEFPEKEHVFQSVTQATTIFQFRNVRESSAFRLSVGLNSAALPPKEAALLTWADVKQLSGQDLTLPLIKTTDDLEILKYIRNGSVELKKVANCYKGDINLGYFKNALSDEPTANLLVRGEHVQPFHIDLDTSNTDRRWIRLEQAMPNTEKRRVVLQNVANMGLSQRVNASIVPEGVVVADSCNCVEASTDDLDDFFLVGLLNSRLINRYFKKFSTNNHVNIYELEELPLKFPSQEQRKNVRATVEKLISIQGDEERQASPLDNYLVEELIQELNETIFEVYEIDTFQQGLISAG